MTREPPAAFLFFGVFTGFPELLTATHRAVVERFGKLHPRGISPVYAFPATRTYEKTMGPNLQRQFFVLEALQPQTCLADIKHATIELETELTKAGTYDVPRPLNIDPGILNDCRLILASTKDYAHRLYRDRGIWEEITLIFRHGQFETLPWTYPDFREPTYHTFFAELRKELLQRTRN